jgi:23S rRNA (cytosine1962-C5)-methyltransferase
MSHPEINLLASPNWSDYELLDSGDGQKLERFGAYTFVRPEVQAMWRKRLPAAHWAEAHATFQPTGEESGGHWEYKKEVAERWEMVYPLNPTSLPQGEGREVRAIRFWARTTPGRHLGVFPEGAAHWEWVYKKIKQNTKNKSHVVNVLNLFGYTGLATLAAAAAGAKVTHLDASKKAVAWARENQVLSGLAEKPVRWIVDDALKFVQREARRGVQYEGILLDPPKFGRGPKGEVWEVYRSLPELLQACRAVISPKPLFAVLTVYAVKASAVHVYNALEGMVNGLNGRLECGELVTVEKSAGRLLASAVYARWGEISSSGEG